LQAGKYEITNAQYVEFLNAVAVTDANGLYNTEMSSAPGGISRSGSSGSYTYSAVAGREDMPVNWVSFYDALRFANWLHNGQPAGAQNATTTEGGAYTITQAGIDDNSITRNAGAIVFLTSEDEWYKAAFYDAGSTSYFDYPAGSDTQITCAASGATANTANCNLVVGDLTDVGSYTGSASPSGTFDQGGNILEWNEATAFGGRRVQRSGSWEDPASILAVSGRGSAYAAADFIDAGFRVATICGTGSIESVEECDDGGTASGDGCDATCQIEAGWVCAGEPSVCTEHSTPTLSPWSQLAVVIGLLGTGLAVWRRTQAAHNSAAPS
jgi:cysteine-rich repeat protein